MALIMQVTTEHGVLLSSAYIRIDEQSGNKENATVRVRVYMDQEKCHQGKPWLEENVYSFTPSVDDDAPNFIKQGYEYIKSLEEFANAIDA